MANPGAESFFGGLLQGVGNGLLMREQTELDTKRQNAASRQRIFEAIANDPNMGWDDKATALEQSISNLLPKDKRGNPIPSPASDAIQKIVSSYRQMGAAARNSGQPAPSPQPNAQASVAPQQAPAIPASPNGAVPGLPAMPELQPVPPPPSGATSVSTLPPVPELNFRPPRTPAEQIEQNRARTKYASDVAQFQTESAFQAQAAANQRAAMRDLANSIGLKEGTPEFTNFMAGRNIVATRPDSLDQAAADLFNKYRTGEVSKEQFDDGVEQLRSMKQAMEKPPTATDAMQSIANYFKLHGYSPDPNSPDYAKHWDEAHRAYTKETKVDPGVIRINALGNTRGVPLTDSTTGVTSYYNWNDVNEMNKKFPGRFTAPTYDPEVQAKIAGARQLAPKNIGTQVQSYGTFIQHTGDLYNTISSLNNTDLPLMNKPINWLRTNSGDPRVKVFLAKLDPVRKEFESFLLNNRALYQEDRQEAATILDENSSPAQMLAVLPSLVHTGTARLEEGNAAYRRTTGQDIPNLVTPQAMKVLKQMGVAPPETGGPTGVVPGSPTAGQNNLSSAGTPGAASVSAGDAVSDAIRKFRASKK